MSETSYEQCHTSYRGYMNEEIDTAREMLRKYGKPCPDAVKELRLKTDMPMSECCNMLRCLWRDIELEHVQSENEKLRKLATYSYEAGYRDGSTHYELEHCPACKNVADLQAALDKNAKLWKLVLDMMQFFEDDNWCDKCSHARECDTQEQYEDDCLMRLVFRDRIEQLRMEVDRG